MAKVIESRVWKHTSSASASIYGAVPWASQADKPNWKIETRGYTIQILLSPSDANRAFPKSCWVLDHSHSLVSRVLISLGTWHAVARMLELNLH